MRTITVLAALSLAVLSTPVFAQNHTWRRHHHWAQQQPAYENQAAPSAWNPPGWGSDSMGHQYDNSGMIPGFAQGS